MMRLIVIVLVIAGAYFFFINKSGCQKPGVTQEHKTEILDENGQPEKRQRQSQPRGKIITVENGQSYTINGLDVDMYYGPDPKKQEAREKAVREKIHNPRGETFAGVFFMLFTMGSFFYVVFQAGRYEEK